jgi:hypothetical protein
MKFSAKLNKKRMNSNGICKHRGMKEDRPGCLVAGQSPKTADEYYPYFSDLGAPLFVVILLELTCEQKKLISQWIIVSSTFSSGQMPGGWFGT